jgi:hypothetical protein
LRALLLGATAFSLFFGLFFSRSLLRGNYIAPSDSLDFGLAAFLSGQHLWTDGMFSGYPVAADPQALLWYPVFQIVRVAGLGWNLFMILPYIIAGTAMFLLIRRMTGSALAGLFGGLVFAYSGTLLAHISHFNQIHAAAWMALVVYGLLLVREGRQEGVLVASAAFALMILAGHPQVVVYTAYVAGAVVLVWAWTDRRTPRWSALRWSAAALSLGIGLAAIMLLPASELADLSRRADARWDVFISKPLPPRQLLSLALPFSFGGFWTASGDYVEYLGESSPGEMTGYIGLLPLSLALTAPFVLVRHRREARLWVALALIAGLLALGDATPLARLFYEAPGYSGFRVPARHLFVVAFCLSVAAGLAFAELITERRNSWFVSHCVLVTVAPLVLLGCVFLIQTPAARRLLASNTSYQWWSIPWPAALAATFIAATFLANRLRHFAPPIVFSGLLITLHVVDMSVFHYMLPGYRLQYAEVPQSRVEPDARIARLGDELRRTGGRALAVDGSKSRFLLPNLPRAWGVRAAGGTSPLALARYSDILGMGGPGDVYPDVLLQPHRGLDLLGVRYALVPERWPVVDALDREAGRWTRHDRLQQGSDDPDTAYLLFRNTQALPLAWTVAEAIVASAPSTLRAVRTGLLPDGRPFDPSETALVEETLGGAVETRLDRSARRVTATAADGGQGRYAVTCEASCLLVLNEVFYPWRRGSIDGVPARLHRADYVLTAVVIPAGTHVVEIWLSPVSVWIGMAAATLCGVGWLVLAWQTWGARRAWRPGSRLPGPPAPVRGASASPTTPSPGTSRTAPPV